jgi:hypothetical protein
LPVVIDWLGLLVLSGVDGIIRSLDNLANVERLNRDGVRTKVADFSQLEADLQVGSMVSCTGARGDLHESQPKSSQLDEGGNGMVNSPTASAFGCTMVSPMPVVLACCVVNSQLLQVYIQLIANLCP